MDFFNSIKTKLKVRNILWTIGFLVFACILLGVTTLFGFSTDTDMRVGIRGSSSGIPIPNWLISCMFLLVAIVFFAAGIANLKSVIKNTEFNQLMKCVQTIGDVDTIGKIISSLEKSKYVKGCDLRYDSRILFYLNGTNVAVIAPSSIFTIRTEITKTNNTEENFVCIYYEKQVLKIQTSKKDVLLLLEDMRKTFHVH